MDRRRRDAGRSAARPDAVARLPAAPGLRAAARRARTRDKAAQDLRELDDVCGRLIDHFEGRGARVIVLSEYGISAGVAPGPPEPRAAAGGTDRGARGARARAAGRRREPRLRGGGPPGRARLRERPELPRRGPPAARGDARRRARCWTRRGSGEWHLDHPRSGEFVAVAAAGRVVHLLLLARRRPGAGLRPHGRHPPQAGLRPGGAVLRPGSSAAQGPGRVDAAEKEARLPRT